VNQSVEAVSRKLSAALLFDEALRLKYEIREQMTQVKRQNCAKEELHDFVQVS